MNKIIVSLFLSSIIFFSGCSNDPTSPNDQNPPPPPAGSSTIGSGGGMLSTDNFELLVPAGAFASDQEITLTVIQNDNSGFDNKISSEYKLDGLPQTFALPLKIKIKYSGSISDSAYIAVGEENWVNSLNSMVNCYHLQSTIDSAGYLVTTIPPITSTGLMKGEANSEFTGDKIAVNLLAVAGYVSYVSQQEHFKIRFPSSVLNEAYDLADYLETAYTKFHESLHFDYSRRTNWPVSVTVRDLRKPNHTVYGYTINSMWGDNYGYMEFNFYEMGNSENMRITAGHEFFHFVQNFYDPRNRFSKAKSAGPNYWLYEASSVWSEAFFATTTPYTPSIFISNAEMSIQGAKTGSNDQAEKYGYGMSSFLKFLTNKYGDGEILKIYNESYGGSTPFSAINKTLPTTSVSLLWNQYIKKYFSYDIYEGGEFTPSWLIGNTVSHRLFRIKTESDTLTSFTKTYSDLSANIFAVKNQFTGLKPDAKLFFEIAGNTGQHVLLFKVNTNESVYLKQGYNSVTLDNFKAITDAGYIIIAVVTDTDLDSPYTNEKQVELKIHVQSEKVFTYSDPYFLMQFKGLRRTVYETGDSTIYNDSFSEQLNFGANNLTVNINTLTCAFDTIDGNYHYQDTLIITMDDIKNPSIITDFYYSSNVYYYDGDQTYTEEFVTNGTNIPILVSRSTDIYKFYEVTGNIAPYVLTVKYHTTNDYASSGYHAVSDLISFDGSDGELEISYWVDL